MSAAVATIVSDGTSARPHCTWSPQCDDAVACPCAWTLVVQDTCAQKLCEAANAGNLGVFVSGANMCTSDVVGGFDNLWYWDVQEEDYLQYVANTVSESIVTAECATASVPSPLPSAAVAATVAPTFGAAARVQHVLRDWHGDGAAGPSGARRWRLRRCGARHPNEEDG